MRMNKRELLWRFGLPAAVMLGGLLLGLGAGILMDKIELRQAGEAQTLPAEAPADGIGRITAARYLGGARTAMPERAARIAPEYYTEGEGPAPDWWQPDEAMAAEWEDSKSDPTQIHPESNPIQRTDAGCPDWNVNTTVYGWDGHTAEPWELDLLSRVFYLEFWGVSDPCAEAGCDAILNLWDTGLYGSTLGASLSAVNDFGDWVYSTYPAVWNTKYDSDGLAWCKAFTAERFFNGPEWECVYFQLGGYHDTDWVPPLYEMDGVYFSGKGWN